jgi:uncharacterized cupredoxin-like copper-binding protein
MRTTASTIAAALLATGLAATGSFASQRPSTLRADVAEWSIVPSQGAVPAGPVRIVMRNLGSETHQLMVVRTRSFAQSLPLHANRAVTRSLGSVLARPGATRSFVVHLQPGTYLLLDNLPWHYWKGTQAAFVVR